MTLRYSIMEYYVYDLKFVDSGKSVNSHNIIKT